MRTSGLTPGGSCREDVRPAPSTTKPEETMLEVLLQGNAALTRARSEAAQLGYLLFPEDGKEAEEPEPQSVIALAHSLRGKATQLEHELNTLKRRIGG